MLNSCKELVRPYYLRWLYFKLFPDRRPAEFSDSWTGPFVRLDAGGRWRGEMPRCSSKPPYFVFLPMVGWHFRKQRSQYLAQALARLGHSCLYLSPHFGREFESVPWLDPNPRLSIVSNGIAGLHVRLPREPVFHYRLLTQRESEQIADSIVSVVETSGSGATVQVVSLPTWIHVAKLLRARLGWPIIYDCHDLLSDLPNMAHEVARAESELMEIADRVFFASEPLRQRFQSQPRHVLMRNGVEPPAFPRRTRPTENVAGYVGALSDWFDVELISAAAKKNPSCSFVLAGRIETERVARLANLRNIKLLGEVSSTEVPRLISSFRVGLIPFVRNELTRCANPIKLYEYFAAGIPVVSSPLPEVRAEARDLAYYGGTPLAFGEQVAFALDEDEPARRRRRVELACNSSWDARALRLQSHAMRLCEIEQKSELNTVMPASGVQELRLRAVSRIRKTG